ncbi:MFS transporter small subunit [Streptomyces sclerotialus]
MTARRRALLAFVWLWVGLPFAYGLYELALKMKQLFTG